MEMKWTNRRIITETDNSMEKIDHSSTEPTTRITKISRTAKENISQGTFKMGDKRHSIIRE